MRAEPRAASSKAGYAGPGPRGGGFASLAEGAALEDGRRRHVRVIGGAGGSSEASSAEADMAVTGRDARDRRDSRSAAH